MNDNKNLKATYKIFINNVFRLMEIKGIKKTDIIQNPNLSMSSVYKALDHDFRNLKLSTLNAFAETLEVPLFLLFIDTNSDEWQAIFNLVSKFKPRD